MSAGGEPGARGDLPEPDLSFHGLSITPDRPVRPVEPLPEPAAGFTFVRELGRGGMGIVYEAREDASGRRVAVKVVAHRLSSTAGASDRFEREARLAASISHPNCVFVYGAHQVHGAPAISMELMSGESLEDRVRAEGRPSVEDAVGWTVEILDGLGAAHSRGIVHRDVKPSNCFLTADGHVKVGDFGLSRSLDGDLGLTMSGAFIGSPLYASPEQVRGREVDQRSDVYSAGATLYAVLAGKPPHSGSSFGDVLAQIVSETPPPLATVRDDLPRGLEAVVAKALAKDPAKRFQDCAAFRRALLPYARDSLTPATLGLRVAAYLIDMTAVSVIFQLVSLGLYYAGVEFESASPDAAWVPTKGPVAVLLPVALSVLWFGLLEWRPGMTPGKLCFGLRVVAVDGGPAPLWRTLVRVLVFFAPYAIPAIILGIPTRIDMLAFRTLTYAVHMITMRKRNGYRGIHEFASGTRVMRSVRSSLGEGTDLPPLEPARSPAAGVPAAIGPYAVESFIGTTSAGSVVEARDPGLGRTVWIHLGGAVAGAADASRPSRLRWLGHGDTPAGYDVYESPGGASLREYVAAGRVFSWPDGLTHVYRLADELVARGGALAPEQIWIDRTGRVRVLDFALGESGAAEPPVRILATAAKMLLQGRARPDALPPDLPAHADQLASRLLGLGPPFETIEEARAELHATAMRPLRLAPGRRIAQITGSAVWVAVIGVIIVVACLQAEAQAASKGRLDAPGNIRPIVSSLLLFFGICVPSLVLAFILRGGLTFSVLGIAVRNRGGALAPRWRCLLRAAVVWTPFLPIFGAAFVRETFRPAWLVPTLAGVGLAVFAVAIYFAIRNPTEGPADKIARTRLVVK